MGKESSTIYVLGENAFNNCAPSWLVSVHLNKELEKGPGGEARWVRYEGYVPEINFRKV